ncbi:uroporphyrinogen decarboxylase [Streptococcus panodentis]|uniref:Uroporphyrinogen decarboxylase n=2 Tax=Streptococcus panodentis TaxID=1581472 RepID=A0ABS5B032_9STRE|nr:uroporphyrinogen decarboxylase family protein [Streptococcus panodentis]MBP2622183.1 uroporphyrinogen decarboxylase [Streptococcus panodentis]
MIITIYRMQRSEMVLTKKELVLKAFRGEKVDRVPVGFWFHFVTLEEKMQGLDNPVIFNKSVQGHAAYVNAIRPDFVKIMSDGFFKYPSPLYSDRIDSIRDLAGIASIGEDHPWIEQQIEVVKAIKATYPEEIASFYNIFAPVSYLKRWFRREGTRGDKEIADFLAEDAELTKQVLDVIAEDIALLTKRVIKETGIEGIYLSTQQIQDQRVDAAAYRRYIEPSNVAVLEAANAAGGANILHICGFEGATNHIPLFKDYPAQVFNWATHHEGVSLAEGRKLFGGRTVLGGFENGRAGLLNSGSRAELEAETKRLLAQAGTQGVILGADCTVPDDFELERLDWVRQAAHLP